MCRIVHIAIHGSEYIKNVCGMFCMFSGIIQNLFQEVVSNFKYLNPKNSLKGVQFIYTNSNLLIPISLQPECVKFDI